MPSTSSGKCQIAGVVLSYWVISISMVFANKYLVGESDSEDDVSIFSAWVQCIVTVVFIVFLRSFKSFTGIKKWDVEVSKQSSVKSFTILKRISPMTCMYVGMLTFNNLCLKHVGVAFFQVARSMTLIFTVVFSVLLLKRSVSLAICCCCAAVAGGFVLGIDQESLAGTLSVQGVIYGVVTSLFVSLNGIFTKKSLDIVDRDSVRLTLYNNVNASILFIPIVIVTGQLPAAARHIFDIFFIAFLLTTGVLSFAIAWISAVQIDLTSPVTHHISANSKSVLQTILAVVYYQQRKQPLWWLSICMVVLGATAYALIRIKEEKAGNKTPDGKDVEASASSGRPAKV